jgi:KDO2-lipid IV(A) lauroyltransferase
MIGRFFSALLYYLVILPVSALPMRALYMLSDALFFVFYHLIGYRKKVVKDNLRRSFPEKSGDEINELTRKFYSHFCDLLVESLKIFTIDREEALKRMVFTNPELINAYFEQGRSVILAGGHYNNWELFAVAIDEAIRHQTLAIYKPLNNQFFDEKMRLTRGKYGLEMIPIKAVKDVFERNRALLTVTIFATDQSPGNVNRAYWMNFLNQETAVLFGTEKLAKEYNYPVVYGLIKKLRRGYYATEFKLVAENPADMAYGEITRIHTRLLEEDIRTQPEFWLWSHRRWKKKRPEHIELAD